MKNSVKLIKTKSPILRAMYFLIVYSLTELLKILQRSEFGQAMITALARYASCPDRRPGTKENNSNPNPSIE